MENKELLPPDIIPPGTIVKLIKADNKTPIWKNLIGTIYRIGYYSSQDGLDVIWLVDEFGKYCQTTDRNYLLKYFDIINLSNEKDYYGINSPPLGPLQSNLLEKKKSDE